MILERISKRVAEHESADGIAVTVCAVRVELTSLIAPRDVHASKVTNTRHLNIVWRLHEMHTVQRAVRDCARSSARLGAPCDLFAFGVANSAQRGRSPEAEVVYVVYPGGLAHGGLGGASTAAVCARLAILRFGRKLGVEVARIPDLVCVAVRAGPDLDLGGTKISSLLKETRAQGWQSRDAIKIASHQ